MNNSSEIMLIKKLKWRTLNRCQIQQRIQIHDSKNYFEKSENKFTSQKK